MYMHPTTNRPHPLLVHSGNVYCKTTILSLIYGFFKCAVSQMQNGQFDWCSWVLKAITLVDSWTSWQQPSQLLIVG